MRRLPGAILAALLLSVPAARAAAYDFRSLELLQPEEVLDQRVGDVGAMSDYVKGLNAAAEKYFSQGKGASSSLDLYVAFRPSGKAKAWIVPSDDPVLNAPALAAALEKVAPPKSKGGLVLVHVHAVLGGYREESRASNRLPQEWTAAAQAAGKPLAIDEVVALAWKE